MKVAFISPNIGPLFFESCEDKFGGAEVQQMLLVKYLVEKNHQVKLLVRKSKYSESPIPKIKGLPNLAAISLSGSS